MTILSTTHRLSAVIAPADTTHRMPTFKTVNAYGALGRTLSTFFGSGRGEMLTPVAPWT